MSTVKFNETYAPAEAERGKFAPIDATTLTSLPSSSRGRYAVLTYSVGSESATASGATYIDTGVANTTYIGSTTFYGGSATVLTPPAPLKYLEIYNNSGNSCYMLPQSTNVNTVTSQGMIVTQYAFYSLSRTIPAITISLDATKSADLRVIGHYVS